MCEVPDKKYEELFDLKCWTSRNNISLISLYNLVFKWNGFVTTIKDLEGAGWQPYVKSNAYSPNDYLYFYNFGLHKLIRVTYPMEGLLKLESAAKIDYIENIKFSKISRINKVLNNAVKTKDKTITELLQELKNKMLASPEHNYSVEEPEALCEIIDFIEAKNVLVA